MREEVRALALHRLSRAREAFAEGEELFPTGSFAGATKRFSYAAFHAARTLLATREVDSPLVGKTTGAREGGTGDG